MTNSDNTEPKDTNPERNQEQHFRLQSLQDLRQHAVSIFASAKQKIQVYSRNLDPRILNNRDIEQAITRFVRSSRFVQVELLITDERNLQGVDHRLVSLAQNFTSFIKIRVIPKDYHENYFAYYLIDGRRIIYRNNADRFESEVHQLPSSLIKQKSKYFDEVWQQSSPASHLRALHL